MACIMPISTMCAAADQPMSFARSRSLHGSMYRWLPLSQAHHDDLVEAVKDGELWNLVVHQRSRAR